MKKTIAVLLVALLMVAGTTGFIQPSFASSQTLEVTTSALHYRSAPWGTIHGMVYKGDTFTVLDYQQDKYSDTWYKIDKGWVHGDFVKIISESQSPTSAAGKVTITTAVLNVRNSVWGTWIGSVRKGDVIDYYDTSKDKDGDTWYQIKYGSGTGWVHGDFLTSQSNATPAPTPTPTPTPSPSTKSYGTVNTSVLNVRDGVWGNWISEVRRGAKYELLDSRKDTDGDTWYQINYSGSSKGWVHGDFLNITKADTTPAPTPTPTPTPEKETYGLVNTDVLNVRDDVWGNWISEVLLGSKYTILDSKKDSSGNTWYQIHYSGSSKGWVHGNYLNLSTVTVPTPGPGTNSYGMVNNTVLNVRDDADGRVISKVTYGVKFKLLDAKKDKNGDTWYQINYRGSSKGWVHGDYLDLSVGEEDYWSSVPGYDKYVWPGGEVQEFVWNHLVSNGYTPESAAGIMGNIAAESSFRVDAIENTASNPGEGIGLIQWSFSRKAQLLAFAEKMGKDWTDIGVQMAFLDFEMAGEEGRNFPGGAEGFKSLTNIDDATSQFTWLYERPAANYARFVNRISAARSYFDMYH